MASDVTDPDQMKAVAAAAVERWGRLDVWVNNAGVMPLSPVEMNRLEEWNWMVDVNIKGVLNGVAAAQPPMEMPTRITSRKSRASIKSRYR